MRASSVSTVQVDLRTNPEAQVLPSSVRTERALAELISTLLGGEVMIHHCKVARVTVPDAECRLCPSGTRRTSISPWCAISWR